MVFIAIGVLGVALLAVSFLLDDVFEAVLPDGWLSAPVVGAFLTATGFGGYLASVAGAPTGLAIAAGAGAGVVLGWVALRLSRAVAGMATDATPSSVDLVGREGRVVTPIVAGGTGEVLIRLGGQPLKLTARATDDVPTGSTVVVVAVLSPTFVEVQTAERFWAPNPTGELP